MIIPASQTLTAFLPRYPVPGPSTHEAQNGMSTLVNNLFPAPRTVARDPVPHLRWAGGDEKEELDHPWFT